MDRRLAAAAVAGLAGAMSLAALVPSHADETEAVGDAVALAEASAGFATWLAGSMVWVPPWLTDPGYAGRTAEAVPSIVDASVDLATAIPPPVPPWATDPEYPGRAAGLVPVIVDSSVDLVTKVAPSPQPWTTDPEYYRRAAEVAPSLAVAIAEKAASEHYGGGAFTGTVTWDGPIPPAVEECRVDRAAVRGTVAITADVAFTAGTTTFTGPLEITGTACGSQRHWLTPTWEASGTDPLGNTFRCSRLEGLVMWSTHWYAGVHGRDCTLNGVVLPRVQLVFAGEHVSALPTTGSMAGSLTVNTY